MLSREQTCDWRKELRAVYKNIGGTIGVLNRDPERPCPFPDALNVFATEKSSLHYHGSFDDVLEWRAMTTRSRREIVKVMSKCDEKLRDWKANKLSYKKNYFEKMDTNLRDTGINPSKIPSSRNEFGSIDQAVKSCVACMTDLRDLPEMPPLPEVDLPLSFPSSVSVISDFVDVNPKRVATHSCLRCQPVKNSMNLLDDILNDWNMPSSSESRPVSSCSPACSEISSYQMYGEEVGEEFAEPNQGRSSSLTRSPPPPALQQQVQDEVVEENDRKNSIALETRKNLLSKVKEATEVDSSIEEGEIRESGSEDEGAEQGIERDENRNRYPYGDHFSSEHNKSETSLTSDGIFSNQRNDAFNESPASFSSRNKPRTFSPNSPPISTPTLSPPPNLDLENQMTHLNTKKKKHNFDDDEGSRKKRKLNHKSQDEEQNDSQNDLELCTNNEKKSDMNHEKKCDMQIQKNMSITRKKNLARKRKREKTEIFSTNVFTETGEENSVQNKRQKISNENEIDNFKLAEEKKDGQLGKDVSTSIIGRSAPPLVVQVALSDPKYKQAAGPYRFNGQNAWQFRTTVDVGHRGRKDIVFKIQRKTMNRWVFLVDGGKKTKELYSCTSVGENGAPPLHGWKDKKGEEQNAPRISIPKNNFVDSESESDSDEGSSDERPIISKAMKNKLKFKRKSEPMVISDSESSGSSGIANLTLSSQQPPTGQKTAIIQKQAHRNILKSTPCNDTKIKNANQLGSSSPDAEPKNQKKKNIISLLRDKDFLEESPREVEHENLAVDRFSGEKEDGYTTVRDPLRPHRPTVKDFRPKSPASNFPTTSSSPAMLRKRNYSPTPSSGRSQNPSIQRSSSFSPTPNHAYKEDPQSTESRKRHIDDVENINCTYKQKPCIPIQRSSDQHRNFQNNQINGGSFQNNGAPPSGNNAKEEFYATAHKLKLLADKGKDIYGRMKTYLEAGSYWIKFGLLSDDQAQCWEAFAKFFVQTYLVSKLSKDMAPPKKHIFLASICLDCSGILFAEVVNLKKEIISNRAVGLRKFFQDLPSEDSKAGVDRGSNPEDSFLEKVKEKKPEIDEYIELSEYSMKSLAHLRDASELRKRLENFPLHDMPRRLDLRPKDLPGYIDFMTARGDEFFS